MFSLDISPALLDLASLRLKLDGREQAITPLRGSAHSIPLPDASVDLVFGNAILHHLDLVKVAGEVRRVLRPGGRGIFKEPIRDSRLLGFLRGLVPYRQEDVSPFERPLRFREIEWFTSQFRRFHVRVFQLPLTRLAVKLGVSGSRERRMFEWDRHIVSRYPAARRYASIVRTSCRVRLSKLSAALVVATDGGVDTG